MHHEALEHWQHPHAYVDTDAGRGERRTRWVIGLTAVMMTVEIAAGMVYGSMALLADGWHMATHAAALGIAALAYAYARRHARDPRYSFGTGKVGALGGFASAVGLAAVALMVFGESAVRLASPVHIRFDEAIFVAVVGLGVNLLSAILLKDGHDHGHGHGHEDHGDHGHEDHGDHGHEGHGDHGHEDHGDHGHEDHGDHGHEDHGDHDHGQKDHGDPRPASHAHHDHNLRGAYLHVLADALTSVLAIAALVAGKFLGWNWMDPMIGILGAIVIARWSYGLLRDTGAVLLDAETSPARQSAIRAALQGDGEARVADLHLWRVGPRHLAVIAAIVTDDPQPPGHYKARLRDFPDLVHVTVEVHACQPVPGVELAV